MTKIEFNHDNLGVNLYVNNKSFGRFEKEKDALYFIVLNDLLEEITIDRNSKCRRES